MGTTKYVVITCPVCDQRTAIEKGHIVEHTMPVTARMKSVRRFFVRCPLSGVEAALRGAGEQP